MFLNYVRMFVLKYRLKRLYRSFKSIGDSVRWGGDFEVQYPERIAIGSNALIHEGAFMNGEGEIEIGNNFVAGKNLNIVSSDHNYDTPEMLPWDEQMIARKVVIGDNVWCGLNVIILPGVQIGEGAVIGAGSVVTKDVEKCAVVAGNPARVIKYRNRDAYEKIKKAGKFRMHPVTQTTSNNLLQK